MNTAEVLIIALVLDAVIGDPDWLWRRAPHPVVVMGKSISWLDKTHNKGPDRKTKGVLALMALVVIAGSTGWILTLAGPVIEVALAVILLAHRGLLDHITAVAKGLAISEEKGRRQVARIVGRDTRDMDAAQIVRATIESAAENLSDGVVAPAFWFLIGGLPGLLIYKITNTADSMIGYRNDAYRDFGWASARFDDLLNLVPARLTAALIALMHGQHGASRQIRRDAKLHRSPNAGWPEAAMALSLDVALSGPRSYGGQLETFAWVNASGRTALGVGDIHQTCAALWKSWAAMLALLQGLVIVHALLV